MGGRWSWVNRGMKSWAGQWAVVVLVSTALGLFFSLSMMADVGWKHAIKQSLAQFWAWGLLTPLIVAVDRRLPFSRKQLGRRVWAHVAACLFFTAVYMYVFFALRAIIGENPWSALKFSSMWQQAGWYIWSMLVYGAIVGGIQAFRYYQHYLTSELELERMERSLSEARLNALRMQLDPHFLFNALNTISSHVERNPKLTRRMIEHLGDLLRMSLETKDRQEVPLNEEIAFLEHYLAIQRIRFGTQLQVRVDVDPAVRFALTPALVLQPLVENAIRHGISRRASGGTVTVTAAAKAEKLEIRVADDGLGLPPGWTLEGSAGLGLSVTRERIAGLYPNGASSFTVRPRAEGGTMVEMILPLRTIGEEAGEHAAD